MSSPLSVFAAEAVGTFFLTFFGAGAILTTTAAGAAGYGLLGVALAHGIVLGIGVSVTAATSGGHLNPAVSIGLAAVGKLSWGRVPLYVVAQVVGSVIAAALLRPLFARAPQWEELLRRLELPSARKMREYLRL